MLDRISYRGWENAYRISNGTVELVVLADVGPRVISYSFVGGENIFHEVAEQAGLTGGKDFRLYGGHRLWVWPEVQRTYFPDNSAVAVCHDNNVVRFTAPLEGVSPGSNLQKELEIQLNEVGSRVTVSHRITNRDTQPTELAPWAPTMIAAQPVGRATRRTRPRSTPSRFSNSSAAPANPSFPTAPAIMTAAPARRAANAWLAPLPPGNSR